MTNLGPIKEKIFLIIFLKYRDNCDLALIDINIEINQREKMNYWKN